MKWATTSRTYCICWGEGGCLNCPPIFIGEITRNIFKRKGGIGKKYKKRENREKMKKLRVFNIFPRK